MSGRLAARKEQRVTADLRSAGFVKGPLLDMWPSADLRSEARLVVASDGSWIIYPGCRTLDAEIQTPVWRQWSSLLAIRCRLVATTEGDCVCGGGQITGVRDDPPAQLLHAGSTRTPLVTKESEQGEILQIKVQNFLIKKEKRLYL